MRVVRIVQIVILIIAVAYVAVVQNANPDALALPGLLPLPVWLVVTLTAVLSFLAGWVPATVRAWRLRREAGRLERRVADLESHVPSYDRARSAPVIPDRAPPAVSEEGEAREADADSEDAERTDG